MSYIDSFDIDDLDDFNIVESIIKFRRTENKFNIHDYIVTESLKIRSSVISHYFQTFSFEISSIIENSIEHRDDYNFIVTKLTNTQILKYFFKTKIKLFFKLFRRKSPIQFKPLKIFFVRFKNHLSQFEMIEDKLIEAGIEYCLIFLNRELYNKNIHKKTYI